MGFNQCNQWLTCKNLKINEEVYMISITQKDETIQVLLTNFVEIWIETLINEIILNRCKELNPLLNVEAINYKEIVLNILNDISTHIVEASPEMIKLHAHVGGGLMKFELHPKKRKPQDFWEFITKPLCISSMALIHQHRFLLDLIKKKDEEIAEYKAEGAELIRKHIETQPFTEEQFKTDICVANILDYTNIFQTIINFYSTLKLDEHEVPTKIVSGNSSGKLKQMEHNIVTVKQEDSSQFEGAINQGASVSTKSKTVLMESKKQKKSINKGGTGKSRTAAMPFRPVKMPKQDPRV